MTASQIVVKLELLYNDLGDEATKPYRNKRERDKFFSHREVVAEAISKLTELATPPKTQTTLFS